MGKPGRRDDLSFGDGFAVDSGSQQQGRGAGWIIAVRLDVADADERRCVFRAGAAEQRVGQRQRTLPGHPLDRLIAGVRGGLRRFVHVDDGRPGSLDGVAALIQWGEAECATVVVPCVPVQGAQTVPGNDLSRFDRHGRLVGVVVFHQADAAAVRPLRIDAVDANAVPGLMRRIVAQQCGMGDGRQGVMQDEQGYLLRVGWRLR